MTKEIYIIKERMPGTFATDTYIGAVDDLLKAQGVVDYFNDKRTRDVHKSQFGWTEYYFEKDTVNGITEVILAEVNKKLGIEEK